MSKPRRNDRFEWAQERIADATKAAADGQGWTFLANLWECSTANALQWCKVNAPPEVCERIGQNGTHLRYPNLGRKYVREERSKPKMHATRQSNGKTPWVSCQYTIYEFGQRYVCGSPTDNHAQYCTKCAAKRFAIPNLRIRVSLKSYI